MSEEFRALEMQEPLRPLHDPAADPAPETFKGDNEGLRDAAQELSERRAAEAPTISRFYHNEGERLPANVTIDAKRGARDLAGLRRQEADIVEQQAAEQFRLEVDADRMNHATGEQPSPEVQEALAPQPEATETAANGVDPEVAKALENPRVRDAIAQQVQVADALRHHYAEALANVAHAQDAQFIAAFPEMAGTTPQTFQTTLQAINQRNPQRAAEIVAHVQRAQAHLQTVQAHRFAEAQRQTQATQDWMRQQDDAFEQSIKDAARGRQTRAFRDRQDCHRALRRQRS